MHLQSGCQAELASRDCFSYNARLGRNMDKKKKPPPGATLIQRLREARLRREQAEAEAQTGASQAAATKAAQQAAAQTAAKTAPPAKSKTALPVVKEQPKTAAPPPVEAKKAQKEPAKALPEKVEEAEKEPVVSKKSEPAKMQQPVDFIHRSISINDLRPHTDNYDQLTEEIRLAGRFAAAGLIAQGLRLARLKDESLYKEHYGTFEEYCRTEHTMSATYAYRLIRMAEMAERIAEEGNKNLTASGPDVMPDPFEVMLGLGHRHLMALLPLEADRAEELLIRGIPLADKSGKSTERIPITRATEQQIKHAISLYVHAEVEKAVRGALRKPPSAVPASRSVRSMTDLVEVLQDWADWLEEEPQGKAVADRIGEGRELNKLAQQLRKACDRIVDALASLPRGKK